MSVIQRRIFYGKVGTADELVGWASEMYGLINANYSNMSYRIMTDHMSGRTDRVVVEVEVENLGEFEEGVGRVMQDTATQQRFADAFAKLQPLIDYAEVEHWSVR